jgi:hypothetical protein
METQLESGIFKELDGGRFTRIKNNKEDFNSILIYSVRKDGMVTQNNLHENYLFGIAVHFSVDSRRCAKTLSGKPGKAIIRYSKRRYIQGIGALCYCGLLWIFTI